MATSVLVVDDDPIIRSLLQLLIALDDDLVLADTAINGQAALGAVRRQCPDAIVCDLAMPVMGGLEALPLLRRSCPLSVIVIFTSDPSSAAAATRLGADAICDKAGEPEQLLEELRRLVGVRRQKQPEP